MANQFGRREGAGFGGRRGPVFEAEIQRERLGRTESLAVAAEEAAADVFVFHERQDGGGSRRDDAHGTDLRAAPAARAKRRVHPQKAVGNGSGRRARDVIDLVVFRHGAFSCQSVLRESLASRRRTNPMGL